MKKITVHLKERAYPILVGSGIIASLGKQLKLAGLEGDAVIVTNPLVRRLHGAKVASVLKKGGFSVKVFEVADSERSKSLKVAFDLVEKIAAYGADKKVIVVALGGGVVGDLAGFVASVYKRGVPFIQIPTTLLAQIDSSIGGKVGVDLSSGKNLAGAFYQPRIVVADIDLLSTLTVRQMRSGLAEAVKYGVIADKSLFAFIEKNFEKLLTNDATAMSHLVTKCAAIKAGVVSRDERETKNFRTILNFGHTVGHAFEAASHYRIQHGEAVALGMRAACGISIRMKFLSALEAARIETLLTAIGLPDAAGRLPLSRVLGHMRFDKKFFGKKNRFVLAQTIGHVVVRDNVPPDVIQKSITDLLA